jgi:drug/metabolite transporter (DMT)-like permease
MLYLLATILLNTLLSTLFKLFPKYGIDALQAIVVNYITCVITGCLFLGYMPVNAGSFHQSWTGWALIMGLGFILIFNLQAYCTKADGITTSTIANKLSLAIPVIFSVFLYHEQLGLGKIAGIILAFPAVYLTTRVKEENKAQQWLWPALLFIGSGLLDTVVKFVEQQYLNTDILQQTYTIHVFAVAGSIGIITVTVLALRGNVSLAWKNVLAGICIGIPNYFSIYFFIKMLNSNMLPSSSAIPVNNIGILVCSTFVALFIFREHATIWRVIGLVMSLVAILLIAFTH